MSMKSFALIAGRSFVNFSVLHVVCCLRYRTLHSTCRRVDSTSSRLVSVASCQWPGDLLVLLGHGTFFSAFFSETARILFMIVLAAQI